VFLFYLAERRRAYVSQIMIYAALGAVAIVFASFGLHLQAFLYVFSGGAGRFWFATAAAWRFVSLPANAGITVASVVAVVIYASSKRSRYFGNTAPLLMLLALVFVYTTQVVSAPWVWALPFLFTFIGGVFADALDANVRARERKMFAALAVGIVLTQAALCWVSLAGLMAA